MNELNLLASQVDLPKYQLQTRQVGDACDEWRWRGPPFLSAEPDEWISMINELKLEGFWQRNEGRRVKELEEGANLRSFVAVGRGRLRILTAFPQVEWDQRCHKKHRQNCYEQLLHCALSVFLLSSLWFLAKLVSQLRLGLQIKRRRFVPFASRLNDVVSVCAQKIKAFVICTRYLLSAPQFDKQAIITNRCGANNKF